VLQKNLIRVAVVLRTSKHRTLHTMKKTANQHLTLEAAAKIPAGENINDWHAVNTLDFYNDLSLLLGILEELCTKQTCPCMSAGPRFKYLWADGVKVQKPLKVSAPEYMAYMMDWVAVQLDDPCIFPLSPGATYPGHFIKSIKVIFKRMFRAYAHIYHAHFDAYHSLGMQDHVNKCFQHFMIYVKEFDLVSEKDMAPLKDFIPQILSQRSP